LDVRQLINHDDIEADIMQGLVHLQLHRRAKSLRRFRTHHSDQDAKQLLRPGTSTTIGYCMYYVPLFAVLPVLPVLPVL